MLLTTATRYGCCYAIAAVLLLLLPGACKSKLKWPRTIEEVVTSAKALPSVDSSEKVVPAPVRAVASAPAQPELPDLPEEFNFFVPEVTARTGPVRLPTQRWSTVQWDSIRDHCYYPVTSFGRFRLVDEHDTPRLFYRLPAEDSTWTEVALALGDDAPYGDVLKKTSAELDTIDLDGRGAAEIVLRFDVAAYGSGGGTTWDHVSVLDVSAAPKLVFRALLGEVDENFGRYEKIAPGDELAGRERSFKVRGRELVLGPVKNVGNSNGRKYEVTQLPAGRYRYQRGKVFRVGK